MEHAGQGTHRVRASAETEQKHFVHWLISVHQVVISIFDIFRQPKSESLAHHDTDRLAQIAAKYAECADTGIVIRDLILISYDRFIHIDNIRVVGPILVPGSVTAHDDVCHE